MVDQKNIFDEKFTNLYALSKTLRFELKPIGKTLEKMRENLQYDKDLQTFMKDQEIENAYQNLKPVLDYLHEQFILESLELENAKKIKFDEYFEKYKDRKNIKEKDFGSIEKKLRISFTDLYQVTADKWKISAGKNNKNKEILTEKGYKILTEKGILDYIRNNIEKFTHIKSQEEIEKALKSFEGFFTYFGGFNQNRKNYYVTKDEKATAVATRIVHENLPKFCDNILFFKSRSEEYEKIYEILKKQGKNLVNKEKKELYPITKDIFEIIYFNSCLSQKQIENYNEKISNANFLINLYNQAQKDKKDYGKLSFFKTLYKQIGCGKKDALFFTLNCDTKKEAEEKKKNGENAYSVEEILENAILAGQKYFREKTGDNFINTVFEFGEYIKNKENYLGVYWSKMAINTISNKYFANWYELKDKFKQAKIFSKSEKDDEDVKIPDAVELEGLFQILNQTEAKNLFKTSLFDDEVKNEEEKIKNIRRKDILEKASSPSEALLGFIFDDIYNFAKNFLVEAENIKNLKDYKAKESKEKIKSWMDNALAINQMLKYFLVKENKIKGEPIDSVIDEALKILLRSEDADWFKWYDALRNYLTKKPQDDAKENKLKLNFENSTLASGWDVNKEPDNFCVILQDQKQKQYLAIIAKQEKQKGYNKIFLKKEKNSLYELDNISETWKKMEYKLLPGPNKMLPKCLIPKSERGKYGATDEILNLYDKGSFKKSETSFSLSDLHKLIDFYKKALQKYEDWKCFDFQFLPTEKYQDISQFYSDIEKQGYKLSFSEINKSILDQLVAEGKIYLFEIKNQDSNDNKKENHKDNLHTLYWKALFENIGNRPKLNGEAELFYRKAISPKKLGKIKNKKGEEVIKNYRYSKEKILFHIPITLNFCYKNKRINDLVNENFSNQKEVYFLGIDRGEKHLAYYSLVDQNGKMINQGSFNEINGQNYHNKLDAIEKSRMEARKNWQTIGTIKELKAGYISQVVHEIVKKITDKPTFIVLEDLNTGFKRGRQKIEKSVYQKFELALAKKLNFLVDKKAQGGETGSPTKALQFTPPVQNYGDIENRKQVGIMLYTRANYTSQTDPVTGWRKTIYLKTGSEENIKKQILDNFSEIGFDGKDYYFAYFNDKIVDLKTGEIKKWVLYSGKNGESFERYRGKKGDKNEWLVEKYNVVDILNKIFVNFDKKQSLLKQIKEGIELQKIDKHNPFESLRFAIDLIQQIRNSGDINKKQDENFLQSPVRDKNGSHFDTRKATENLPKDADANGAYNIARKGIIMNAHIQTWQNAGKPKYEKNYSDLNLFVSDEEWDLFLVNYDEWKKQLTRFSSRTMLKILKNKKN